MKVIYYQRVDGEWFEVEHRSHQIRCCDCGLVHKLNFRLRKGKIQIQAFRDNRATGQRRRRLGIRVVHDAD